MAWENLYRRIKWGNYRMSFDLEKYRSIGGFVKGGTPRFGNPTRADILSNCQNMDSPIAQMVKDTVMYHNIKSGNGSDKSLKRDAEIIQKTYTDKQKEINKIERFKPVQVAREKYKRRYKTEPI